MSNASTESSRSIANGATRQVKAGARRIAESTSNLPHALADQARSLGRQSSQWLQGVASTSRRHPYATAGIVALAGAVIGGLLWARRRG